MRGIDLVDLSCLDPAADHLALLLHQSPQPPLEEGLHVTRTADQLHRPEPRRLRQHARAFQLASHVSRQCIGRLGFGPDLVESIEPDLENARQHRGIEQPLGAKIVVQVGLGYLRPARDFGSAGAAEAFAGEDHLGGLQNLGLVALADSGAAVRRPALAVRRPAYRQASHIPVRHAALPGRALPIFLQA